MRFSVHSVNKNIESTTKHKAAHKQKSTKRVNRRRLVEKEIFSLNFPQVLIAFGPNRLRRRHRRRRSNERALELKNIFVGILPLMSRVIIKFEAALHQRKVTFKQAQPSLLAWGLFVKHATLI